MLFISQGLAPEVKKRVCLWQVFVITLQTLACYCNINKQLQEIPDEHGSYDVNYDFLVLL